MADFDERQCAAASRSFPDIFYGRLTGQCLAQSDRGMKLNLATCPHASWQLDGGKKPPPLAVAVVELRRQLLLVDRDGNTAIHSGEKSLGIHTEHAAHDVAAAGNLLANDTIPRAMVEAFLSSEGHLGDRLITAMRGALAAGGEAGPVHSAGMLLVDRQDWPLAELRCDWSEDCPIENIAAAWDVYSPQMDDYVTRALDPSAAPSYGVPGDE